MLSRTKCGQIFGFGLPWASASLRDALVLVILARTLIQIMVNHVLIIADIEGSSGCPDYAASAFMTASWPTACLAMTRDVQAVTTALFDAGVPRITIHDFHRTGYNLIPDLLDSRATLIQGYRRGSVPGIGNPDGADAVLFVGLHAASGTHGFLAHTLTSRIARLAVNGRPLAEVELFSAVLGPYGIRPLFFSGCPAACDQAREALPGITTFAMPKPTPRAPRKLHALRQTMARRAVAALENPVPPDPLWPRGSFHAEIRFRDGAAPARRIAARWHLKRVGNTILLDAATIEQLYADLIRICYLTPLVQAFLPFGMALYRVLGITGLAWVKHRLKTRRYHRRLVRFYR